MEDTPCCYQEKLYTCSIYTEQDNLYETIRRDKASLPTVYDEVFQQKHEQCESDASSTYESPVHLPHRNWWQFIPLWVKVLTLFLIIGVTAGYFDYLAAALTRETTSKSKHLTTPVGETTTPERTTRTTTTTTTDTTPLNKSTQATQWSYQSQPWFTDTQTKYYDCAPLLPVDTVLFQPLSRFHEEVCFDKNTCNKFVSSYVSSCDRPANFTFYVDAGGAVYGGRSLTCPYLSGELWVAVLHNKFVQHSEFSALVLHNFYQIVAYAREAEFFVGNVREVYLPPCVLSPSTFTCDDNQGQIET